MTGLLETAGKARGGDSTALVRRQPRTFRVPLRRLQRGQDAVVTGLAQRCRKELSGADTASLRQHGIAVPGKDVGLAAPRKRIVGRGWISQDGQGENENGLHGRHDSSIGGTR